MNDSDTTNRDGMSRRSTLALATSVAAFGVALGMRSTAFAQGKGEGKLDAKGEGKGEGKAEGKGEGKAEGKGEGKGEGKAEGKGEGKGEGKFDGKEGRLDGKAGRIKVDVASDGSTSVDVRCADDEPMQACADLTRDIVDRIKAPK
jgi:hypothetical protein